MVFSSWQCRQRTVFSSWRCRRRTVFSSENSVSRTESASVGYAVKGRTFLLRILSLGQSRLRLGMPPSWRSFLLAGSWCGRAGAGIQRIPPLPPIVTGTLWWDSVTPQRQTFYSFLENKEHFQEFTNEKDLFDRKGLDRGNGLYKSRSDKERKSTDMLKDYGQRANRTKMEAGSLTARERPEGRKIQKEE